MRIGTVRLKVWLVKGADFTVYFPHFIFFYFDPYGRYNRFYGVTDQSNRTVTVSGGQYGPIHKIDRNRKN